MFLSLFLSAKAEYIPFKPRLDMIDEVEEDLFPSWF